MEIFNFLPYWVWLIISALFYTGGEFFSEKLILNPTWENYAILIILDVLSISSWLPALNQKNNLAVTGTLWLVFALVSTALLGVLFFGETLTPRYVIGIMLAAFVVMLLS